MNILIINHEYPPVGGGGGVFSKQLSQGLSESGHKIYMLTAGSSETIETISDNLKIIYIKIHRKDSVSFDSIDMLEFVFKAFMVIGGICRKYKIDVINSHFIHTSALAVYLSRVKVPHFISALGADVHDPTRYRKIRFIMNFALRKILKKSYAMILSSSDMRDRVIRLNEKFQRKIAVIPHSIIAGLYSGEKKTNIKKELKLSAADKIILSVCRLIPRKNLFTALKVIRKLIDMNLNIKYFIVGSGPEKENIKNIISQYSLDNYVFLFDYVDEMRLMDIYMNSDVFFMPSFHEAFGIAALEAMAAKLPPVCSDIGGWSDFVISGQTGFICQTDDEYIDSLKKLLTDNELYDMISRNCRQLAVSGYDYKTVSKKYSDFFEGLIKTNTEINN